MRIAFTGKAGSGKSTLASLFVEIGYIKISFAAPLKYLAEQILLHSINKLNAKDREFLQKLGTLARENDEEIWIKHFDKKLESFSHNTNVVVDDLRYLNEAKYLRSKGFVIIKVEGRKYDLGELSKHPSEFELEKIKPDIVVDNSNSLEVTFYDLNKKLLKILGDKYGC
ncbi:MAG: hypothetical protein NWE98_02015 [Candidatus Bathyarchaeota archaeon]|nr:hypothetical protein [Candidatus Bathyarchaeota archaeon]